MILRKFILVFSVLVTIECRAESPIISAETWGVYTQLVGKEWRGVKDGTNWKVTINWEVPNKILIEQWENLDNPSSAPVVNKISSEVRQYELHVTSIGDCNRKGVRQVNGSVLFRCKGLRAKPYVIDISENGRMAVKDARYFGDAVVWTSEGTQFNVEQLVASKPNEVKTPLPSEGIKPTSADVLPPPKPTLVNQLNVGHTFNHQFIKTSEQDADKSFYNDININIPQSKPFELVVKSEAFEPHVVVGTRLLDGSIQVTSVGKYNKSKKSTTAFISSSNSKKVDVVRVSTGIDAEGSTYSMSLVPYSKPKKLPLLQQELDQAHHDLSELIARKGIKSINHGLEPISEGSMALTSASGNYCSSVFNTDAGLLRVEWTAIEEMFYGISTAGAAYVSIRANKSTPEQFFFTAVDEAASLQAESLLNWIRRSCRQIELLRNLKQQEELY